MTIGAGAGTGSAGTMPAGTGVSTAPIPDVAPPFVGNFVPSLGTSIGRTDGLQFDVVDDSGPTAAEFVNAVFADGTTECAWDSSGFTPQYAAGSSRLPLASGGNRYFVRRSGGWFGTPVRLDVFAVDRSGNLSSTKASYP